MWYDQLPLESKQELIRTQGGATPDGTWMDIKAGVLD
jgi:hypothetical protein